MNSKPVLMIHEIKEEMFTLPLDQYTLTFDDGLYSQYYYWPKIQCIPTDKIFFISSGCISRGPQSTSFPSCEVAHEKAHNGIFEDYMSIDQIKELAEDPNTAIGCHGHSHRRISDMHTLSEKFNYLKQDTRNMMSWFSHNLKQIPTAFCFPHNDDMDGMYRVLLERLGFTSFYGRERIPIETLLHI